MNRLKSLAALAAAAFALLAPSAAQAGGFEITPGSVGVSAENPDGTVDALASSHPYAFNFSFKLNTDSAGNSEGGTMRDFIIDFPAGWVGNPLAAPRCSRQIFQGLVPRCSGASQVGIVRVTLPGFGEAFGPLFNLSPSLGLAAEFGFTAGELTALPAASVRSEEEGPERYGVRSLVGNLPTEVTKVTVTLWGVPADPRHDAERSCLVSKEEEQTLRIEGCSSGEPEKAFVTLPATCGAPMPITISADSRLDPGNFVSQSATAAYPGGEPAVLGGCDAVPFSPTFSSQPTTKLATNPSGLDFELKLPNQGLTSPGGIAETEPRKVTVALPEGVTINPSVAEGIGICSEAQYNAERFETAPGAGCPEASKLGSVLVHTPLLEEPLEGSLYLAAPYENPFGTLAAIYMLARSPERGVLIKQAGKLDFDSASGRITTTFEGLPPLPFADFKLHFREGARAPLATPASCGEYETVGRFTPFSASSDAGAIERTASFQIERGADGGACPSGGTPPFHPGLEAGSINNAAGRYSPFNLRLTRTDSEQEITHFSIKLPPGITGKLAGIPFCPDAAIAAAKARERQPHGGQEELDSPSCPAASEVGHTLVGAGVGSSLAYVPGKVYLAGPYNGSPLSIVAITAAVAGPFDLGTVVVREALRINPETAEVFIDATGSDPIPHIVNGIPVHLRDVRVYTDRPDFVLNPTSCNPTSTASTVLGSGTDFTSEADDVPVTVATRYQAADCASLPYKPAIQLKLKGATKRGGNPAFTAILRPRPGDANSRFTSVALPHSEFLDQSHIKTICTRVQFKAGAGNGAECPPASVYGHVRAFTPLLAEPLEGPIFLRSSEHPLPDLVLALHGQVDFTAVGRIDSVNGGIRNTFETIPDAPITKVEVSLPGGRKSLLENSTNLCRGRHNATVQFKAHSGKEAQARVPLKAKCGKARKHKKKSKRHSRRARASALAAMARAW